MNKESLAEIRKEIEEAGECAYPCKRCFSIMKLLLADLYITHETLDALMKNVAALYDALGDSLGDKNDAKD